MLPMLAEVTNAPLPVLADVSTKIAIVEDNATLRQYLAEFVAGANELSLDIYEADVVDLELTQTQARRLKPFFTEVREDGDFIGMSSGFEFPMMEGRLSLS